MYKSRTKIKKYLFFLSLVSISMVTAVFSWTKLNKKVADKDNFSGEKEKNSKIAEGTQVCPAVTKEEEGEDYSFVGCNGFY